MLSAVVVPFGALCATAGLQLGGAPEAVLGDEDGGGSDLGGTGRVDGVHPRQRYRIEDT